LRKLTRREIVAAALLAITVLGGAWWWLRGPDVLPAASSAAGNDAATAPVPRIDIARLDAPRDNADAGRRNLFDFGAVPVPSAPPVVVATPPPTPSLPVPGGVVAGGDGVSTVAPSAQPLNVKYIGSVDNGRGVKVAVLLTDRDEVLTGQAGQVIANRYRIARIGIESVDLEDVGTGQSRRIPLRGS
jgi:hypothetical protein